MRTAEIKFYTISKSVGVQMQFFRKKIPILSLVIGQGLFGCIHLGSPFLGQMQPKVQWSVLDVSDNVAQAESNILQFSNGQKILIDAGEQANKLLPTLESLGVRALDKVFISHPHKDHYNALPSLIAAGYIIKEVYLNLPPKSICDSEIPWGCDWNDLQNLLKTLNTAGVKVKSVQAGDVFIQYENIELSCLYAHDGTSPPVGQTDINDLSIIMSLKNKQMRVLFTGDLNKKFGGYLAGLNDLRLKAQLLKVPHHGTESLAPDSFFDWVAPEVAFIPAPASLWSSDRSKRPRDWFKSRKIPTFVTGEVGRVTIDILPNSYSIKTSH